MKKTTSYDLLLEKSRAIHNYQSILSLLHWDLETYMPSGSISARSEQIAQLSSLIHDEKTSRSYKNLLEKIVSLKTGKPKSVNYTATQKLIIREWRKDFLRASKLPSSFVKEFSQITSEASQVWAIARKENNFKLFLPFLEKIISMSRQKAEIYGFTDHPYDALIECYEPCMTAKRLTSIFNGLQKELKNLLKKIGSAKPIDAKFLNKKASDQVQTEIGHWIAGAMPIDQGYTRLDISSHPFSIALHPRDSRITTRILPNSFMSNVYSILHEAGHSMYEMGLPVENWGTSLCEAASLSVHESQSRWWETLLGKNLSFWKHYYPQLKKKIPSILKNVSLDQFYRAINQVKPSFIRVEADEVTYCLHVVLRFEIEKQLISGTLAPIDLPAAWNAKFKELFGIFPPSDKEGCLQDIHWSLGDFGYFPTYALGNLLAAQLFGTFSKEHTDWEKRLEKGELEFVRGWLKENIHQQGRAFSLDELTKKITGKPLSEEAYCRYLKKKYETIYHF
jgi:carboxypeptidase Taq